MSAFTTDDSKFTWHIPKIPSTYYPNTFDVSIQRKNKSKNYSIESSNATSFFLSLIPPFENSLSKVTPLATQTIGFSCKIFFKFRIRNSIAVSVNETNSAQRPLLFDDFGYCQQLYEIVTWNYFLFWHSSIHILPQHWSTTFILAHILFSSIHNFTPTP